MKVEAAEPLTPSKSWKVRQVGAATHCDNPARWELHYYLEPVGKPGDDLDLDVSLRFREPGRPARTASWHVPVRITTQIQSVSMDEVRPVTGPESVPPATTWWPAVAWVETALVVGALALVVTELVRRRLRRASVLAPEAWAMRELDRLASLDLSTPAEVERIPTLLSDVVRRYLEVRFRIQAPRLTTPEFLEMMQDHLELTPPQQALLREFLERCDLAKFARATLSPDECSALAQQAMDFVRQTSKLSTSEHAA
jgi:hypothetical protein